jgi:hypothetical protein
MLELALIFTAGLAGFSALDWALTRIGFQSPYYLVHSFHNAIIIGLTAPDVLSTFLNFESVTRAPTNLPAACLVASLHLYHCLLYWRKFRADDWLHHILMVTVALPIGFTAPPSTLLGYSLFFTTGLPGCIDYFLLFLVRNGLAARMTEKRVNRVLNLWVRSPGCASHAAFSVVYALAAPVSPGYQGILLLPALLVYWNGQYFMEQVVVDADRQERIEAAAAATL